MICPKCGSDKINVQIINDFKQKKRGCLTILFVFTIKLILFFFNIIIWLISLLIPKKQKIKVTQHKMAICQNCGHSWEI